MDGRDTSVIDEQLALAGSGIVKQTRPGLHPGRDACPAERKACGQLI
jgi:hypothetical protein